MGKLQAAVNGLLSLLPFFSFPWGVLCRKGFCETSAVVWEAVAFPG